MSVNVNADILVISEGLADKAFLTKLIAHWLPAYSVAFPYPTNAVGGVTSFTIMLEGLRAARVDFKRVKGVLLIADSGDDPANALAAVASTVKAAGHYPVPEALDTVAAAANDHPATAITTIPSTTATGGLETLYNEYFKKIHPQGTSEVNSFLNSPTFDVGNWNAEKQGKANFASFVAATNRDDPSRAASYAFKDPALIDEKNDIFKPLADKLRVLFDALTT